MPTVTGTLNDLSGNPLAGIALEIIPVSGISVETDGTVTLPIRRKVVTASDGSFASSLVAADYQFEIEGVIIEATIPDQASVDLGDTDVITNTGNGGDTPSY